MQMPELSTLSPYHASLSEVEARQPILVVIDREAVMFIVQLT